MNSDKCRTVLVKKYGSYDGISVEDYPLTPLEGLIEVEVEYAGLNFADLYSRQGLIEKKLPFILGIECAGTIKAVGVEETDLKVGQKILCYDFNGGMYRDIVRVPKEQCFPLPDYITPEIAVTIFVNYLTAYFSLHDLGNLKPNEKILILSCAGGVGCAVTQLTKETSGVQVFGVASASKESPAKENGVDVFFSNENFQKEIEARGEKFDLIVSNQSGHMLNYFSQLLRPLGRLVIIGANNFLTQGKKLSKWSLLKSWWGTKNIAPESLVCNNQIVGGFHLGLLLEKDRNKVERILNDIFKMFQEGKIKPKVHSKWPMSKIVEATKELGERRNVGKVLICMKE